MKVKGQKLKIFAKKARAANKRRVAFFPKIATRWIYFIHIFRQLLVPNLSKSEKKSSVLALVPYYTDYLDLLLCTHPEFLLAFKLLYLILFLLRDIVTRLDFKILFSYFYSAFDLYLNVFMN